MLCSQDTDLPHLCFTDVATLSGRPSPSPSPACCSSGSHAASRVSGPSSRSELSALINSRKGNTDTREEMGCWVRPPQDLRGESRHPLRALSLTPSLLHVGSGGWEDCLSFPECHLRFPQINHADVGLLSLGVADTPSKTHPQWRLPRPFCFSGDTLVFLCPWLIQEKTGEMLVSPEGRWLDPPHRRRGGGRRATEDQRLHLCSFSRVSSS